MPGGFDINIYFFFILRRPYFYAFRSDITKIPNILLCKQYLIKQQNKFIYLIEKIFHQMCMTIIFKFRLTFCKTLYKSIKNKLLTDRGVGSPSTFTHFKWGVENGSTVKRHPYRIKNFLLLIINLHYITLANSYFC